MKNLIKLTFLFLLVQSCCYGQAVFQGSANPYLNLTMQPDTLAVNGMGIVALELGNAGQDSIVPNSLRALFSMSVNGEILGLDPTSDPQWTVFSLSTGPGNTIVLRNTNGGISGYNLTNVRLNVRGSSLGGPSKMTGNIGYYQITNGNPLLPNPPFASGTQSSAQGDIAADNNGSSALTVVQALAVKLADVTSTSVDCAAKIVWNSFSEDPGTFYDIEYSPDGVRFVKVGTVAGRSATGSKYEFSYSQANGKGFYRLKIGDLTGQVSYSKVVNVVTNCNEKKVFVYPNPIKNQQDLHINVSNFTGKVKGELINAVGQVIFTKSLVNGSNLVQVTNLSEGIYIFKVSDDTKEMQNFRIVVIK